ncbi:MAG: hypothetical protein ACUVXJ_20145 [Phycisphaerae bacterium]
MTEKEERSYFDAMAYLAALQSKAERDPHLTLFQAMAESCKEFGLENVVLQDAARKRIHGRTLVSKAVREVRQGGYVTATIAMQTPDNGEQPVETTGIVRADSPAPDPSNNQRSRDAYTDYPQASSSSDQEVERFVREFDQRERTGGAMWAKYVVNTFLPELGMSPLEGKRFLRQIEAEGVISTTKVPSRNNPEFSATRFHLNRDHPMVKTVLEQAKPIGRSIVRPLIKLPPGSEPLSEQIIRERR